MTFLWRSHTKRYTDQKELAIQISEAKSFLVEGMDVAKALKEDLLWRVGGTGTVSLCWECRRCGQGAGDWGPAALGPPLPGTELGPFCT